MPRLRYCADTAAPLCALDATLVLAGPTGSRRVPLEGFITGPGATAIRGAEILTAIELPPPAERTGSAYLKENKTRTLISLPEGSWGEGGFHYIWLNEWTEWTWKHVYEAEAEMIRLAREFGRIADEPVPAEELEKARALAKGRFVLRLENPQGMTLFGLSREVLEGEAEEPDAVLEGLDAVTADDVQRVAQDVIGTNGLNLALIGPFEDASRFEQLLAG